MRMRSALAGSKGGADICNAYYVFYSAERGVTFEEARLLKNVCKCGERAINPAPCEKREQAKRETANSQYRSYQRTAGII